MNDEQTVRILVAEDDMLNQRVIQMLLKRLGCLSDVVGNGKEATDAWEKSFYHLILMDFEMPDMNGVEAARKIREREQEMGGKRTPIIALSGHSLPEERDRCMKAGMDDYLVKPLTSSVLKEVLAQWIHVSPPV